MAEPLSIVTVDSHPACMVIDWRGRPHMLVSPRAAQIRYFCNSFLIISNILRFWSKMGLEHK